MNQNDLLKALTAVLGKSGATKRGKTAKKAKGRTKLTETEKAEYRAANDAECIKLFASKGHTDVKPRINVMTYDKFLDQGRRVRKGEKSIKVGAFSLFHISQTDPVPAVAQAAQPAVTVVPQTNGVTPHATLQ